MPTKHDVKGRAYTYQQKKAILDSILTIWCCPSMTNLRLGQLIKNAIQVDLNYIEDDDFIDYIKSFYNQHKG